ncbi:hypothetical protein I4U23_019804 [Adineta vaga]|nr:hypothetical protein I4U23_019804 [Adineta vaga]
MFVDDYNALPIICFESVKQVRDVFQEVCMYGFAAHWLCSITILAVPMPSGPLRSHITGGFKAIQT